MTKTKIIFRADGGPEIGMGHFIRTLALAEMLREHFNCVYATRQPTAYQVNEIEKVCHDVISLPANDTHFDSFLALLSGDEIVVLDNYFFGTDYQKAIRKKGCQLVCIDNIHDKHFVADIVINHVPIAPELYDVEVYTKLLLGFEYALLRSPFYKNTQENKRLEIIKTVFLCFGGADFNNLTCKSLIEIAQIPFVRSINIIIGNAYRFKDELLKVKDKLKKFVDIHIYQDLDAFKLIKILNASDIAVVPCSTIILEVISQNIPAITGFFVDNQLEMANHLKGKYPHILVVGDFRQTVISATHFVRLKEEMSLSNRKPVISSATIRKIQKVFLDLEKRRKCLNMKSNRNRCCFLL